MRAYDTIEELSRLARLPTIDDAQLETLITALDSSDSYTVQEDGGYGSTYSNSYEVTVRGSAERSLESAGAKVLSRLVKRLRLATAPVRQALLRVLSAAEAKSWASLPPQERAAARNLLELAVGSSPQPLSTLAISDDQVTSPAARARDLIALRLLAIDAGERATEPVLQALLGPSRESRKAAVEGASFLGGSPVLATKLVDALLDPRTRDRSDVSWAIRAAELRLDATQRARLAAVVDDREVGWYARNLLGPYLRDSSAEAELPLVDRVAPAIARALASDTNEGAWRTALSHCGAAHLARALVPVLREALSGGKVSDTLLHHLGLVGPALAPIVPELLRYLDPKASPSGRHVRQAIITAEALKSPLAVPALIALLATRYQYPALRALAAMGPAAADAIPALEQFRFVDDGVDRDIVLERQAEALAKIRAN